MDKEQFNDALWSRWHELEEKFDKRSLSFSNEEMDRYESFEAFLNSRTTGEALRLLTLGY